MRRPVWRRDWAGFSGGWYGDRVGQFGATVLGIYGFGYSVDISGPLIGDVRIGCHTKAGRENPYRRPGSDLRPIYVERRSNADLRDAEAWAREQNARRRI